MRASPRKARTPDLTPQKRSPKATVSMGDDEFEVRYAQDSLLSAWADTQ